MHADVSINCGKRIVEKIYISVSVDGPRQADPLLLTATQVYTLPRLTLNAGRISN